jgi:hypothetical protein
MQTQPSATPSVTSSRVPFGCLLLFGLAFAAGGLLALVPSIRAYRTGSNTIVGIIVGGVFTCIGVLIMVGARYGATASAKQDALKAKNPDKPWLWRDDWVSGVISDSNKQGTIGIWIMAVFWNAIAWPSAFMVFRQVTRDSWLPLLIAIFPLVGIFIFVGAIQKTLASMKFGTSKCRLDHVPIVPGRAFRGSIELNTEALAPDGYRVRICSVRSKTTGSSRHRTTVETMLWDAESVIAPGAVMRSPMGTRIPFQFATPPDAHVTDESDFRDRYFWRLSASAEVPGVDYSAQFDVPVFQTGEAADGSEFAAFDQRHRAEAVRHAVSPATGVHIRSLPGGGEEFRIVAQKTFASVLGSLIFVAAWNAAIVATIYFHAPWGIPAVLIAIDLLILYGTLDYFLGKSTISVDKSGVHVRKQWLGSGSTKSYAATDIESIDGTAAGQNSASFGVTLKMRDGTTQRVGAFMRDRSSADTIAAKMMIDLGRS